MLAPQLDQPQTGIGRYVEDAVAGLVAIGAEPWVACRATGAERAEELGVPATRIQRLPARPPVADAATLLGLVGRRARPEVVHGTKHVIPLAGTVATVLTVHDLVPFAPPAEAGPLRRVLLPRAHGACVRRATLLLPTGEQVADDLVSAHPELAPKVHAVGLPRWSRLHDATPLAVGPLDDDRPFALHLGDLDPRKNTALLARIWPAVTARTDATLVLAGARHAGSSPPADLAPLLADGSAIDLGPVSDGELRWLHDRARVSVLCSHSEGYGYPAAEAIALGCPLLTSPVPALADHPPGRRGDCVVLDPADPDGWIDPLVDVLRRPRAHQPTLGADDRPALGRRLVEAYARALRRTRPGRRR